jgi:sulfite reductase (NADPH) flavoprotein alpha-component
MPMPTLPPPALIPVLPESAPFTPEQRAYLNGFLAGLFSHAPVPAAAAPAAKPLTPLAILFGSQTGTAEKLAKRIAKEAGQRGFAPTVHDLAKYPPAQLAAEPAVLLVTSTYGDGEPPDNARAFWEALRADAAPRLEQTRFSLCALGDSNYPRFCQFGRDVDARLEALGARRVTPRQDCDVELDQPFATWLGAALSALQEDAGSKMEDSGVAAPPSSIRHPLSSSESSETTGWSKTNPYPARLKTNRRLSGAGSAKDVRHFEIALGDSGLTYEAGDALGVWPANCPDLVAAVLAAGGWDGEEAVPGRNGAETSLRLALLRDYELGRIPNALLAYFAQASGDAALRQLVEPSANGALQKFLHGRDVLDLLQGHSGVRLKAVEFTALLRKVQPRLYSISSSPKAHPGEVHLTVSAVRYEAGGRARKGVASCFLADRCAADTPVPVFVHANAAFRPPAGDVPLIMIGPGTGIAPFRAFLEERAATGAAGRNWLFFGDQTAAQDYLYREEIGGFVRDGRLARLDLAWSRDQAEKVYVQHRMLAAADELWRWLEAGAAVYVCGDASRMAKDVDAALHEVIGRAGGRSADAARDYVKAMQAGRRYQRDVY